MLDVDSGLTFNSDELVGVFLIDLQPGDVVPGNNFTTSRVFPGSFLVATMELSFQLECLPGFTGEECLHCVSPPCDVGSICEPGNVTCITTDVIDRITTSSASALSTVTQGNTDNSSSSGNNVGIVAGVSAGAVVGSILLVLFIVVILAVANCKWRARTDCGGQASEGKFIASYLF